MSVFKPIQRILKEGLLMKKALLCSSVIFLLTFMSLNAQAYIYVYEQLPHPTGGALISSELDPSGESGSGATVYDDFTLSASYSISGITWWGISYPIDTNQLNFRITFYADDNGSYGDVVASYSPYSTQVQNGVIAYSYPYTLGTSFQAGKYWLSIYNDTPGSSWSWQDAADYGNGSIQDPLLGDPSNVAFQLTFTTSEVPIPATAWLLGAGLIGLVVIRRRVRTRYNR